jgi:tRNA threonylcarbamoyladenosine biosynthesis protein TsaE
VKLAVDSAAAMETLGARLAQCRGPGIVYLEGELGTGKTTLVRGLLRGLGYRGRVRSPTYTLVEPYPDTPCPVFHLDLYRLADPEELEWLGLRDLLSRPALLLIEWPERGAGSLPTADLRILIRHAGSGREVELLPQTATGEQLIAHIEPMQTGSLESTSR